MNRNSKLLVRLLVFTNMATILLYLFPPIVQSNQNSLLVAIYLSLSVFLVFVGINKGISKGKKLFNKKNRVFAPSTKIINFFYIFYGATFLLKYAFMLGLSPFDIPGMISRLAIGMADPSLGYSLVQDKGISSVNWSTFFLISILNQIFFVFSFVVWKKLNLIKKTLLVIFVLIELFYWIGTATNFGVIIMFTNVVFVLLLKPIPEGKRNERVIIRSIAALLIFAIVFFAYNMSERSGGDTEGALNSLKNQYQFREDSFILMILPESLWSSYYIIYSYVCQGYEALGCAMDLPITWTGFCGNNPALMSFAKFLTGYDAMLDSYMVKLEAAFNIDSLVAWHSAYLWWANDFTLIGALIIVFILSFFCGFSFVLGMGKGDMLSSIVFVVLANMLLFLFANNTYLSSVFYSFMFLFPYWFLTRVLNNR